jgi:hypothetical protein
MGHYAQEELGLAWNVYLDGEYIASFKRLMHAGILVSVIGAGTVGRVQVKINHGTVVYTEGLDGNSEDNYDMVGAVVMADPSWPTQYRVNTYAPL